MNRRTISRARLIATIVIVTASLAGCSTAHTNGDTSNGSSANANNGSVSTKAEAPAVKASSGLPHGITCDKLASLMPTMTAGLTLNEEFAPTGGNPDSLVCSWGATAQSNSTIGTNFDVTVNATYQPNFDTKITAASCKEERTYTTDAFATGAGGCAWGSLNSPNKAPTDADQPAVMVPEYIASAGFSCNGTVSCIPPFPSTITDASVFKELDTVAGYISK